MSSAASWPRSNALRAEPPDTRPARPLPGLHPVPLGCILTPQGHAGGSMAEDDEADRAYQAALALIEAVRKAGHQEISFNAPDFHALTRVPPEIVGIHGLHQVKFNHTQVTDIYNLAGLSDLRMLDLSRTPVDDIAPLASLESLTTLFLNNTPLADITALAALTELTTLDLSVTLVKSIAPIAALRKLRTLALSDTQVRDTSPLVSLQQLRAIYLGKTLVSDIAPLAAL